jgi:alcohol dehydrogenase class IV
MDKIKHALLFALVRIMTLFGKPLNYLAFTGEGSARQLCAHIARGGHRRVLVVTDKALRELGIVDRVLAGFAEHPVDVAIYDGVLPDPTFDHVSEGLAVLRGHGSDAILAIGGGSSIDAAKVIAAAATSDADPRDWIGFGKVKHDPLPTFVVPTTAGTGSEATQGAVISDPVTHEKSVLSGAGMLPAATALDPDLQLGLPAPITAATGMDALTHAIEAYISVWQRGNARDCARRAIPLVFGYLRRAVANGEDREAREAMCFAAYYAGMAINQVNVGNVHAIAHQLGGKYGIPHGVANAMVLPEVLEFCAAEAEGSLAELAELIGVARAADGSRAAARAFIDAVVELRDAVGIAATSDRLRVEDFDYLTELAVNEAMMYFAPRLLDAASTRRILSHLTAA